MFDKIGLDIREKRLLDENDQYEKYYLSARNIDILGIACKSFWRNLYPKDAKVRADRLEKLAQTLIYQNLKRRKLNVSVYMANPYSDFVRIRSDEENNPKARDDILKGIDVVELMAYDLSKVKKEERTIVGSLEVRLYDKNPYVSVFRVDGPGVESEFLAAGFLFQQRKGYESPQIGFPNKGDERKIYRAVNEQLSYFRQDGNSHRIFYWTGSRVDFTHQYPRTCGYDVFLCHNSSDKKEVRKIAFQLREHGILSWLDEWVVGPAETWIDALEKV